MQMPLLYINIPYFLKQKPPASISTIMSDPRPVFEARSVFKVRPETVSMFV